MNESSRYWIDLAAYDLDTAQVVLQGGRYLHVGFLCHLVAEKSLKAHFAASRNSVPPYTHNLRKLAEKSGAYSEMSDEQKDLLDVLQPLNIEARYPTYKEKLSRALTEAFSRRLLRDTGVLYEWIKQQL